MLVVAVPRSRVCRQTCRPRPEFEVPDKPLTQRTRALSSAPRVRFLRDGPTPYHR